NKGLEDFGRLQLDLIKQLDEGKIHRIKAQEKVEEYWMGALRRAVIDGDISRGSLMAGQSVGLIGREMPVQEIMDTFVSQIENELQRVKGKLG
ncbi:2-nitropropane dioxygenase, partial [candidate division KSB1 bacterium]|nr:2-nitropropane dioxygenase [candidate division KSB1 bacterium]